MNNDRALWYFWARRLVRAPLSAACLGLIVGLSIYVKYGHALGLAVETDLAFYISSFSWGVMAIYFALPLCLALYFLDLLQSDKYARPTSFLLGLVLSLLHWSFLSLFVPDGYVVPRYFSVEVFFVVHFSAYLLWFALYSFLGFFAFLWRYRFYEPLVSELLQRVRSTFSADARYYDVVKILTVFFIANIVLFVVLLFGHQYYPGDEYDVLLFAFFVVIFFAFTLFAAFAYFMHVWKWREVSLRLAIVALFVSASKQEPSLLEYDGVGPYFLAMCVFLVLQVFFWIRFLRTSERSSDLSRIAD